MYSVFPYRSTHPS
jgi:hypothetical protein